MSLVPGMETLHSWNFSVIMCLYYSWTPWFTPEFMLRDETIKGGTSHQKEQTWFEGWGFELVPPLGTDQTWRIDQKTVWLKASSVARDTERCFIFSGCSDSCANTQKPIDRGDVAILLTLPNTIPLALWHLLTLSQILLKSQLCMPWTWAHTACIPLIVL